MAIKAATITAIDWHVSSNAPFDGIDTTDTDEAASFERWLDVVEAALLADYPNAVVNVYSHPGQLQDRLSVTLSDPEANPEEVAQEIINFTVSDAWQRGDFWVALPS